MSISNIFYNRASYTGNKMKNSVQTGGGRGGGRVERVILTNVLKMMWFMPNVLKLRIYTSSSILSWLAKFGKIT